MKKIVSILVSIALLVTSMCITLVPVEATDTAVDTTSADALAATLGATDENLIMSESFDTDGVTPYTLGSAYTANIGTNSVVDGKWVTEVASDAKWKNAFYTDGWADARLADQIITFEFRFATNASWCHAYLYYRSDSTDKEDYNYCLDIYSGAGFMFAPKFTNKDATQTNSVTTSMTSNGNEDIYNVVLLSTAAKDSLYMWKKGTAFPTTPILELDTSGATKTAKGDIYLYTDNAAGTSIDDIKVYNLSTTDISAENMKIATGLNLSEKNLVYKSNLSDTTTTPVTGHSTYTGTSNVANGKWQVTGAFGSKSGLSGKTLIDFAYGFQVSATGIVTNSSAIDFIYHSSTGWNGMNPQNRLATFVSGGKLGFTLYAKESAKQSITTSYGDNDIVNIIMTYVDKQIAVYIWATGEAVPTVPTLSVTATVETEGDLHFFMANATFKLDNFFVYDLADTALYPEQIEAATGIDLDEDMLVYNNNFDTATEPPAKFFDDYLAEGFNGTSVISGGKWVTGGTFGTSTGLTKLPYLKNFAFGFQLEADSTASDVNARFIYHSTTGWNGSETNNLLKLSKSGDNLSFTLYANDNIDAETDLSTINSTANTTLTAADKVNIVMTYVDGKVSAYIWKAGTAVPTAPTLTVDAAVATSGDFYFSFYNNPFELDNFYVYDLTSDDSDGVYTTMESSYQIESTLATGTKLPKTIETTIKLPTIMTGGAGNTILGNYADKDWTFSFEINANGNPYVVYNPPWREWKKLTFDMIDVRTGEWEHLALVLENANGTSPTLTCRLNGDEIVQTIDIPAETVNTQYTPFIDYDICSELYIGRDARGASDKYYFKGKIKNLTMFSDVRTVDEIKADMNGVDSTADALIADYNFDGCYGTGVTDNSPNSYDLVNVGYMATEPEAPTDYDYSFAVVGDTQILTRVYPEKLSCIYDWLVANKEAHNIQYVMGLGDITDADTDAEWERAAAEISKLNGVVPYSVIRGNHDSEAKFSKYLTDIYSSQIDGCYNNDINSSYKIFTVGEVDYLLINLNMGAVDAELAWAENLIASHPNHNVIITTHIYLDSDGTHIDDNGTVPATICREGDDVNNGDDIWAELVSKYSNISLVLSGHVSSTEVVVTKSTGNNGNTVTQMLIDPQSTDESYSAGPAGLVTMLYFSDNGKTVEVRNYSTVRDEYFGAQNQFTMEVDTVDYLYGDANDDAAVDIRDMVRISRALTEDASYNKRTADYNRDNVVNATDIADIRKKLLETAS